MLQTVVLCLKKWRCIWAKQYTYSFFFKSYVSLTPPTELLLFTVDEKRFIWASSFSDVGSVQSCLISKISCRSGGRRWHKSHCKHIRKEKSWSKHMHLQIHSVHKNLWRYQLRCRDKRRAQICYLSKSSNTTGYKYPVTKKSWIF